MRRASSYLTLACCAALYAAAADAETRSSASGAYPIKPVRVVIPFAPGGGLDVLMRSIHQPLSETLGQPLVADNRPARDGIVAEETVARANPDGYTLLAVSTSHAINPATRSKLPYDTLKDFAPITQIASQPLLLIVPPGSPIKSVAGLIEHARKAPGTLNYGASSSATQLPMELFNSIVGIKTVHVPYKGAAPVIRDLLGGHIQLSFGAASSVLPLVKAGKLTALATSDSKRSPRMPEVPTIAESGAPGYRAVIWSGLLAPAGTPRPIIDLLNREVVKIIHAPAMKERLATRLGLEAIGSSPEESQQFIREEIQKWARIAKLAGVKVTE